MKQISVHTSVSKFHKQQDGVTGQKKITTNRLRKIKGIFEILKRTVSKFYNPSENLTIDEVIVLFRGRVIFQTIYSQKAQAFWHQHLQTLQLNWLHSKVHLGKDGQWTEQHSIRQQLTPQ
jgi:hypothetical protein